MCHISQFYACSQVNTGSELYYICELGKYLKEKGEILSLKGVILPKTLEKSDFWGYFAYAHQNNFIKDVECSLPTSVTLDDLKRIHTANVSKTGIYFESQTNKEWVWQLDLSNSSSEQKMANLMSINTTYRSQALVSLVAYVAVERLITGFPEKLTLNLSYEILNYAMSIVDLIMLKLYSTSISWCNINANMDARIKYETWLYYHRDRGYIKKLSTLGEKQKYIKEVGLEVGDVVLVYNRDERQTKTFNKAIVSARTGVIREIGENYITISMYNLVTTKYGKKRFLDELESTNKNLFVGKELLNVYENREKILTLDIGIDYMLYTENMFMFTDLTNVEDSIQLWVSDGTRENIVELDAINATYWLLKDNEIEFNEERYKKRYGVDCLMDYDRYMNGEGLINGRFI